MKSWNNDDDDSCEDIYNDYNTHHHHLARSVAICRQNDLSSASCTTSVTGTPVSRPIWKIHVVGGRPRAPFQLGDGRSPPSTLQQVRRIWLAGTSFASLATWPNKLCLRFWTMNEAGSRPVQRRTSSLKTWSRQQMWSIRRWHRVWKESRRFQSWSGRSRFPSHRGVPAARRWSIYEALLVCWASSGSRPGVLHAGATNWTARTRQMKTSWTVPTGSWDQFMCEY